jgi:hypothetical protein
MRREKQKEKRIAEYRMSNIEGKGTGIPVIAPQPMRLKPEA